MAKRKRSQTSSTTNPSPGSPIHTLPSEAPTATLPDELLDIVLRIACQGPGGDSGMPDIDFKTTLAITSVSKSTYNYTIPLLYAHVRLTKPSDLLLYVRTVSTQPSLATYTKTLWIGPDEFHSESRENWPLNKDCTAMRSSIVDPALLPIGVNVGTYWSLKVEASETESWIEADAREFLRKACRRVGNPELGKGISLQSGGTRSFDGKRLPTSEGHFRVYQVQQGLDTFLHRVRQKQESSHSHGHVSSTPLRVFSAFDRFDHPMMYDRSDSAPANYDDDWTLIQQTQVFDGMDYLVQIADPCDESDPEDLSSDEDQPLLYICTNNGVESTLNLTQIICDQVASGAPTMGALIVLSRVVLARSQNLLCLALTSYMQLSACGYTHGPSLDRVHLLTVGPPARRYQMALNLNHQGLKSVRRLRLWENGPSEAVARTIDSSKALPSLEHLECTWSAPWDNAFDEKFWEIALTDIDATSAIERLLGCTDLRIANRRQKPFHLTVWAHHDRVEEFYEDPGVVENHPHLELRTLPWDAAEFKNCEHYQRPRALARIRKRWEKECQEVLALPPEKLAVKSIVTEKKPCASSGEFYEGLQVIEEGNPGGPFREAEITAFGDVDSAARQWAIVERVFSS